MSGFDDNPFGEPTIDNPFAVSRSWKKLNQLSLDRSDTYKNMLSIRPI